MHNTYTILFTWRHILVRKVHIKFQCQQASSFGEKVEQVIKKAKNNLFYVNYAHIQLAMNDKEISYCLSYWFLGCDYYILLKLLKGVQKRHESSI